MPKIGRKQLIFQKGATAYEQVSDPREALSGAEHRQGAGRPRSVVTAIWRAAGAIVSWCVGHLGGVSAQPEVYGETYAKVAAGGPAHPAGEVAVQVSPSTKKQFQILKGLMGGRMSPPSWRPPTPDGRAS